MYARTHARTHALTRAAGPAQWVAKHGEAFESVLRAKNSHQQGWGFLGEDYTDASAYYRGRVRYELAPSLS